mmetsp:Transcript_8512/g.14335  ORF Transcript_8512/g.14335 Transcript_8512/m.14335 type:complete len:267 (+) Transcript_8512:429-1229(+)
MGQMGEKLSSLLLNPSHYGASGQEEGGEPSLLAYPQIRYLKFAFENRQNSVNKAHSSPLTLASASPLQQSGILSMKTGSKYFIQYDSSLESRLAHQLRSLFRPQNKYHDVKESLEQERRQSFQENFLSGLGRKADLVSPNNLFLHYSVKQQFHSHINTLQVKILARLQNLSFVLGSHRLASQLNLQLGSVRNNSHDSNLVVNDNFHILNLKVFRNLGGSFDNRQALNQAHPGFGAVNLGISHYLKGGMKVSYEGSNRSLKEQDDQL